jgi:NADPH2:quinone reductase
MSTTPSPLDLPAGQQLQLTEWGQTPLEAVDKHLHLVEQLPPDPSRLGPNDVVVAVRAVAVGWVDLLMMSGQYQHAVQPPYTPGLEYAGEVVWAGEQALQRWPLGTRVLNDGLRTGPRSVGPYKREGGFATYALAPADGLRRIPDTWRFEQGCGLLGNYETAWHCLVARGRLQAGETVLIHGASGSTGLAAVHVARLLGATVIATGRSVEKLAVVAEQGAHHVIHSAAAPDDDGQPQVARFRDEVKALTGGRGVDVVYDAVGGPISLETLRCVAFGARYCIVGWAATPFVARGKGQRGAPNANVLPTNLIMMKGLDVLGCPTVISTHRVPSIRRPRLAAIDAWIEEGKLVPHVGRTFAWDGSLDSARAALRAKWRSEAVGTVVLRWTGA